MSSKNTKLPITQSGQHNQFQLLIDLARKKRSAVSNEMSSTSSA